MTRKSQPLVRQMETEVVAEVVPKDQNQDVDLCMVGVHESSSGASSGDAHSGSSVPLQMTPQSKRRSILVRMMRPVSVAFGETLTFNL